MDNQLPSSLTSRTINFSTQSKQQAAQKTVAQLLNDKNALADWVANIEKIRQKEFAGVAKHTS